MMKHTAYGMPDKKNPDNEGKVDPTPTEPFTVAHYAE
jgi:hypothetical protein